MQLMKRHLAPVMAGLVILGAASYVVASERSPSSSDEVVLAQSEGEKEGPAAEHGRPHPGMPGAIRGELTVHAREGEGFDTVRFDRGVIASLDGATVVITEDDGTTAEIATTDDTRIGRDGQRAGFEDLQAGDHVAAFRVKEGDTFVTKGIRAISPERWEEFEDKRESSREGKREGTREDMRERFRDRRDAREG